nr:C10 family peptidase [Hymenobacter psoromatis]
MQVGPLIQSTWGQDVPYNAQCRFNGVMCQTGCVATSMAQVMRYWQYPARYNWAAMTYQVAPTTGYPELAELMHNIGDNVGMSYCQTASSADSYKIPDGFRSFGYGSADYRDYPNGSSGQNGVFILRGNGISYYYDVMDNLRHNQPVIFGGYTDQSSAGGVKWGQGSGHSWVSDGFIENYDENGVMTNLFYHMNWGWNNLYNGWFTLGNWAIYTSSGTLYKNYQYCQDVVINIHP